MSEAPAHYRGYVRLMPIRHPGNHAVISFEHGTVDLYATVGAYNGAVRTSDALVGIGRISEVISAVVDLLALQSQHIDGTGHHTETATLAASAVDYHRSFYFCHDEFIVSAIHKGIRPEMTYGC